MEVLRRVQEGDDQRSEVTRMLGGVLLAIACLVVLYRTSSLDTHWAKFPQLIVISIPALVLLGGGLAARSVVAAARPWHAVWIVTGLLLLPLALFQFINTIGGDPNSNWNSFWIFAVTALLAASAGMGGVRFVWLLAGLAVSISWLSLWNQLLSDGLGGDFDTFRVLCLVAAAVLIGFGYQTRNSEVGAVRAPELMTAGGLIFLLGAVIIGLVGLIGAQIAGAVAAGGLGGTPVPGVPKPSVFWDAITLVGSLGLIFAGNRWSVRGPVYVGGVGAFLFALTVGADLDDSTPHGTLLGWPLLLLIAAAAAIAYSARALRSR